MRVTIRTVSQSRLRELKQMLSSDPEIIVGVAESNGNNSLAENGEDVDVLIWEPEIDDGFDLNLLDIQTNAGNLILVMDAPSEEWISSALNAGVKAILSSDVSDDELIASVKAVAAGLVVLSEEELTAFTRALPFRQPTLVEPLTHRESEVLAAISNGLTNKGIAFRLNISEHTVKFHVATILSKLGASSRTEAVTLAIRQGLIMV